jgi:hypothetical protein
MAAPWSSPVLLDSCRPSGRGCRGKAREATACGLALTRRTRLGQSSSEEDCTTSLEDREQCRACFAGSRPGSPHSPPRAGRSATARSPRGPGVGPAAPFGGVMQPGLGCEGLLGAPDMPGNQTVTFVVLSPGAGQRGPRGDGRAGEWSVLEGALAGCRYRSADGAAGPAGGARRDTRDRTAMLRVTGASDLGFGRVRRACSDDPRVRAFAA